MRSKQQTHPQKPIHIDLNTTRGTHPMNNPITSRTGSIRLKASSRRPQVLELRTEGKSVRQIADELGCSPGTVMADLNHALNQYQESLAEHTEAMVSLELQRLDCLQVGLWELAINGDCASVDRVLKIMDRRAKLLGLDAPTRIAATNTAGDDAPITGVFVVPAPCASVDEWLDVLVN